MNVAYHHAPAAAELTDRELMLEFESIGDSCEFGLVQRNAGAEPLGLLRFSGVPITHLTRALERRFDGIAEPENIRPQVENGEYMVKLTKYDFIYHAFVREHEMDADTLRQREVRRTRFLVNKLIGDLENPAKVLVIRQNEPLLAHDLAMLRAALGRYGASTLLWVLEATPGHPPGTVEIADDHLLVGYVRWLAPREDAPNIDHESWLRVCREAHALWRPAAVTDSMPVSMGAAAAAAPTSSAIWIEALFGADGNGPENTGSGWSAPENGFTWAIDDRSVLVFDAPAPAEHFVLDINVIPYQAPPRLPDQRLSISVNGQLVHEFAALPRGTVSCRIPGGLLRGRDKVEIVFEHPDAARPCDIAGEDDQRRLAVAFCSLTLKAAPR